MVVDLQLKGGKCNHCGRPIHGIWA
jgi:hypothetical protein